MVSDNKAVDESEVVGGGWRMARIFWILRTTITINTMIMKTAWGKYCDLCGACSVGGVVRWQEGIIWGWHICGTKVLVGGGHFILCHDFVRGRRALN